MAVTDPQDCLAYHLTRPLSMARDMRKTPLKYVSAGIKEFMAKDSAKDTCPETEALWFYTMNHGMAEIRKAKAPYEPLGKMLPYVKSYYDEMSPKAVRAFYYLVLICTREARHLHHTDGLEDKVTVAFGETPWAFLQSCKGESDAHTKLLASPPHTSIGNFVGTLRMIFYHGKFSGGYGGPAWGAVTDCLERFVLGEFTAEMMLDTVWTLAHNNGPIFNKGHMYKHYTNNLYKILDVQASGQMNEFVLGDPVAEHFTTPALVKRAAWLKSAFPEVIGDYVDYFLVEALGSKHKYAAEKAKQVKLHGVSETASLADKKAAQLIAMQQQIAEAAALMEAKKWFHVMPDLKVAKIERTALAA